MPPTLSMSSERPANQKKPSLILAVLIARPNPMAADRVLRLLVAVPVGGTSRITAHDEVAQLAGRHRLIVFVDETRLVPRHLDTAGARAHATRADWR